MRGAMLLLLLWMTMSIVRRSVRPPRGIVVVVIVPLEDAFLVAPDEEGLSGSEQSSSRPRAGGSPVVQPGSNVGRSRWFGIVSSFRIVARRHSRR